MSKIYTYNNEAINAIVSSIINGGIVIFPTETVYALACDATNGAAVERIYEIKSRKSEMPLSILVQNIETIAQYVKVDSNTSKLIRHFSPGPITYVLDIENLGNLTPKISKNNSVGFRIPNHQVALEILRNLNVPLVATSTNISGEPAAVKFEEIAPCILDAIDIAIRYEDKGSSGVSSTVVKIDQDRNLEFLRNGKILQSVIKDFFYGTNNEDFSE